MVNNNPSAADPNPLPTQEGKALLTPQRPRDLSDLFWSLNAMALQGFGGVMSVTQRVIVDQKRWYTSEQFVEAWAVAQVLPGPNIINFCSELGARYFGLRGVLVALAGLLAVPFCITITLAALYSQFAHVAWVSGALRGMSAVAAGLIIATGLRMGQTLPHHILGKSWTAFFTIAAFAMVGLLRWNLSAVLLGLGLLSCVLTWRALKSSRGTQHA